MKPHQVLRRLRDLHDEIRALETTCAQLLPDAEDGSSAEVTVVLAIHLKDLSGVVALLELKLAKRNLLRTLH